MTMTTATTMALVFVTDGRIGQQDHSNTERGIEAASGAGHTDPSPIDDGAEATLDFLTSDLGQNQFKDNQDAVENAQGGGHTDPSGVDFDPSGIPTEDDLKNVEFILSGGGVTDPVEDVSEGSGESIHDSVQTAHDEFAAIAESAASLIDALDLNFQVNVEKLDDDFE
jgi:hypothetical protein